MKSKDINNIEDFINIRTVMFVLLGCSCLFYFSQQQKIKNHKPHLSIK